MFGERSWARLQADKPNEDFFFIIIIFYFQVLVEATQWCRCLLFICFQGFLFVCLNKSEVSPPHLPFICNQARPKLYHFKDLLTYLPDTYWGSAFVITLSSRCAPLICRVAINKCLVVHSKRNHKGIVPLNLLMLWLFNNQAPNVSN